MRKQIARVGPDWKIATPAGAMRETEKHSLRRWLVIGNLDAGNGVPANAVYPSTANISRTGWRETAVSETDVANTTTTGTCPTALR
ncbi:hypothetical protein [Bradyrhizobium sp.]|uniref:hypothetical protein n=1 Tax=Bradyrhizobium sp. TaxID=376 RepID=UPI003C7715AF